jgi:transcriptional regulator with XRE-family HTH domain
MLLPEQLRSARRAAGITQHQAAARLGVSQAYLALIETGRRRVTAKLASGFGSLYGLGPTALPLDAKPIDQWSSASLAAALARLGYPGFRYLRGGRRHNPASLLLAAVAASNLEVRVAEALPWLVAQCSGLDWEWLMREARVRDLQNRLGFLVTLGRELASMRGDLMAAEALRPVEESLNRSRLVREDTLCQDSLSTPERRWLRQTRPAAARHWNLLTDLDSPTLPYAPSPAA